MSVWFAYRCHYNLPGTLFVKRFDETSLPEWFRNHCPPIADNDRAHAHVRRLLDGLDPYSFGYFLSCYAESGLPPPQNDRDLRRVLQHWSVEGDVLFSPGAIQVLDDDDELEMAFYLFDETFARKHPERTAWLTQEDWRLPADAGAGPFKPLFRTRRGGARGAGGPGTTYLVCLSYYDSCSLSDLFGADRIDGVRLPQLARYLATVPHEKQEAEGWLSELVNVAEKILAGPPRPAGTEKGFLQAIRRAPDEVGAWDVYGDWLEEQGRPRAELWLLEQALERIAREPPGRHGGDIRPKRPKNRSEWRVTPHLAQLSLHISTYRHKPRPAYHCFVHWILFDDLWASAHPDLANSLLRQLDRWDALSGPRSRRSED